MSPSPYPDVEASKVVYTSIATDSDLPQPVKSAPRHWRYSWWDLLGDCSPADVAACGLSWKLGLVAWAWNQHRALSMPFWREIVRLVVIALFTTVVIAMAMIALIPVFGPPLPEAPQHDLHTLHTHTASGPGAPCPQNAARLSAALCLVALLLALPISWFLARRRSDIRQRFGIPGTFREDLALWLCCPTCALAQETRTIWHEQVHQGVWYGPLPGVHAPAHLTSAPVAQHMHSAA